MNYLLRLIVVVFCMCMLQLSHATGSIDEQLQVYIENRQFRQAEQLLRTQLGNNKGNEGTRFQLARVLAWQGKYTEAIDEYDKLLGKRPNSSDFLLGKAQTLNWAGQPHEALLLLDKARAISPDYEEIWRLQTRILKQTNNKTRLAGLQEQAQKRFPHASWHKPLVPTNRHTARTEVEIGLSFDELDNLFDDWSSYYLEGEHEYADDHKVYALLEQTQRFDLYDEEVTAGWSLPVSPLWYTTLEASISPSYKVKPKWMVYGNLQRRLQAGWNGQLGFRHKEYEQTETETDTASLTAEKYWDHYRVSYTLYGTNISGPAISSDTFYTHVLSLDYYYSEESRFGVVLSDGKEMEYDGTADPPVSDIRAITIKGRHWYTARWALSYELHTHEQGVIYTRHGIRAGLRYRY